MNRRRTLLSVVQVISALVFIASIYVILGANGPAEPLPPKTPEDNFWTAVTLIVSTSFSLATLIVTTVYKRRDERRAQTIHELTVTKTQLEIERLRKELEEAQQEKKK